MPSVAPIFPAFTFGCFPRFIEILGVTTSYFAAAITFEFDIAEFILAVAHSTAPISPHDGPTSVSTLKGTNGEQKSLTQSLMIWPASWASLTDP